LAIFTFFGGGALNMHRMETFLNFDDSDIADAAGWEGEPTAFIHALIECGPGKSFGFLEQSEDGSISIHDWMDYAGRLIEKRQANTSRMRKARAKHVQSTCKERAGATVPNRTVPNSTVPNNNNNAHKEIEITVNDSEENVFETTQTVNGSSETVVIYHEVGTMAMGTQSVAWAEKNWGRILSPGEADSIIAWVDEFSIRGSTEPDAVIIEALKRCLDADARNMNYLRAVLTDWRDHKVLTVAHVEARESERKSQKEHNRNKDPGDKTPKPKPNKYDQFYL